MTKKITLMALIICGMLIYANTKTGHSFSTVPPTGHAGAFALGELTCAKSGCHSSNGAQNDGSGSLSIQFPAGTEYTPGTLYDMELVIDDPGFMQYGFQLIAVADNGQSIGQLVSTNSFTTITTASGRDYLSHSNIPDAIGSSYPFSWQAPASDSGTITFFATGVSADGNNSPAGDWVYFGELALTPASDAIGDAQLINSANLFPSPASTHSTLEFTLLSEQNISIRLLDISGRTVQNWNPGLLNAGHQSLNLDLSQQLTGGQYILQLQAENQVKALKIMVQ